MEVLRAVSPHGLRAVSPHGRTAQQLGRDLCWVDSEHELERCRLLERIQEQEGVIQYLWGRYTADIGREPNANTLTGPQIRGVAPAAAAALRRAVEKEQTFDDAVTEFVFKWTHCVSEAHVQRAGAQLLYGKRPAAVARQSGDAVLRNFKGRGVSLQAFERLLQKLRCLAPGSLRRLDLSNNCLNDPFIPGIVEALRRGGVRQLDVSQNNIGMRAVEDLCRALPQSAPYLEALNLRSNPCASCREFAACLAAALPQLKFLARLAVSLQCHTSAEDTREEIHLESHAAGTAAKQQRRPGWVPAGAGPKRSSSTSGVSSKPVAQQHDAKATAPYTRATGRARSSSQGRTQGVPAESAVDGMIGSNAIISLIRTMASMSQLRLLDLGSSSLARQAIQRLSHLVREDRLVVLSLSQCSLNDDAAEPLLAVVGKCRGLVSFSLRKNSLRACGKMLCEALHESVSLTDVDLAENTLGDDFGEALSTVLQYNEVLWKVDIAKNPLGVKTGDHLARALERNLALESIGDNDVSDLYGLGVQKRLQLQQFIGANQAGVQTRSRRSQAMGLSLDDFDWHIVQDESRSFEPMIALL